MSSGSKSTDRAQGWGSPRVALGLLTLINLINYLDRYVVAALVESLRRSPLALSDAQAGTLMTGFIIVYTVASPLFGMLGDRGPRLSWISLGVVLWSLATGLGGFAGSFVTLFCTPSSCRGR